MQYSPLTTFCEARGRWARLAPRGIRRRLIAGIVADWPDGVTDTQRIADVLQARGRARLQQYGSVWVVILGALLSELIRLAIEWWLAHRANRIMLSGWHRDAETDR